MVRDMNGRAVGASAQVLTVIMAVWCLLMTATGPAVATDLNPVGPLEPLVIVTGTGRHTVQVEIADTREKRSRGLMFRTELASDRGMLFDFKTEQPVSFWMRNTYIPLDMIFIRANGRIARIEVDTTPLSERTVPSGGPVRFVLEMIAGSTRRLGMKAGDEIEHRLVEK